MAPTIPSEHPAAFRAGDTLQFTVPHPDFSGDDGWTLAYTINGAGKRTGTVVTAGTASTVTLAAAVSATLPAGTYTWQVRATKAAEAYTVAEGIVTVGTNVAAAASLQHPDEVLLGYLDAELAARAQSDHTEYVYEGRSLKREPLETLLKWQNALRARIQRRRHGGRFGSVRVEFTRVGP